MGDKTSEVVLVTSVESCRVIGAEGRQLKVIGISNATSCDDAERTDWNVTEGRRMRRGCLFWSLDDIESREEEGLIDSDLRGSIERVHY